MFLQAPPSRNCPAVLATRLCSVLQAASRSLVLARPCRFVLQVRTVQTSLSDRQTSSSDWPAWAMIEEAIMIDGRPAFGYWPFGSLEGESAEPIQGSIRLSHGSREGCST